jgi:hypothetical protein
MAEATRELVKLKVEAAKRRGADKITIVDHTGNTRQSCTIAEGVALVAGMIEKGKGGHILHVVDQKAEKKRKLENPKGSTRRIFNCRTPEQYKELNGALEPYYEEAIDPQIAIDCIIKALRAFSRQTIRTWVNAGHEPSPSKLPEFLR